MRAYARADELAPGHPLVLYDLTLLSAASGKVATARAQATKLRHVVDRVLQDRPPLEMVEILEPMKALTESVLNGDTIARLPPLPEAGQHLPAGWRVLVLALPLGWTDSLEVTKGQPASAQVRLEADGPRPVLWLLTIIESRQAPDLDRLVVEARRGLPGTPTLGEVHSFSGQGVQGRTFVADDPGARPEDPSDFPRVWVAFMQAGDFMVTGTRFLRDRDPGLVDESERILRALQVRDLTPPHR